MATTLPPPPAPRRYGPVNWGGLKQLYLKEVQRFMKVFTQTIAAPVVTTLLFLAIFTLALGGAVRTVLGVPFSEFLAPGLIVMAMAQNAFANTSSSLVISKIQGNIVDVLMPPISPGEFVAGYALAGATRGMVVGAATWIGMLPFVNADILHPLGAVFYAFNGSLMLALLGMLGGIWADKFDHIAAFTNFVVTPLTFLSGTFYSIERLPALAYDLAHFNPFFYMIDGFRWSFLGTSDTAPWIGAAVLVCVNAALWTFAWSLVRSGYKLKT